MIMFIRKLFLYLYSSISSLKAMNLSIPCYICKKTHSFKNALIALVTIMNTVIATVWLSLFKNLRY